MRFLFFKCSFVLKIFYDKRQWRYYISKTDGDYFDAQKKAMKDKSLDLRGSAYAELLNNDLMDDTVRFRIIKF